MIKAVIIDDEPLARSIVLEFVANYPQITVVQECNDGFEGVKAIYNHRPDLLFLDIQMPKINGFEMLELLEKMPAVIFTTAFDEYALKAFDTHAVDYLLKPFSKERFDKAMQKYLLRENKKTAQTNVHQLLEASAEIPGQSDRIVVKTAGKIRIIPTTTVHYLEAADDYVKVVNPDGGFLKKKTMAFYENNLPAKQFVRVHRSYIVNVHEITRLEPYEKDSHLAILKSGAKIPVSQAGYIKLKQVLGI